MKRLTLLAASCVRVVVIIAKATMTVAMAIIVK
jgi:hypothetical protein